MKRGGRYFPLIEEQLRTRGLPADLKFVAIVESSLRPEAKSHAGAVGLWQFIAATGSRFQLGISQWVDERQDPVKSTEAALGYLQHLYGLFGDWFLALAAYNAGEDRVRKEMSRQGVSAFFDLVLPAETERYVFRVAVAKVILSDPARYGFHLEPGELYEPAPVERVRVSAERDLDLIGLAQRMGITYRTLRTLNPQIRDAVLPRGTHELCVPVGKGEEAIRLVRVLSSASARNEPPPEASRNYDKPGESGSRSGQIVHTVRSGETVSTIAQQYGVDIRSIQQWNQLGSSNLIRPGQRLTIRR
jgi:hypothetical protein